MTPWKLRHADAVIRHGGILAYPTEAIYGLGCDPLNGVAVKQLCALKNRHLSKGLILIGASLQQLMPYCQLSKAQQKKILGAGDKPITWVVPAQKNCPRWISGDHDSVAIRITRHPQARQLCQATGGALISTSANISGQAPARTALAVQRMFAGDVDLIIHGDTDHTIKPSEIRDIQSGKILRPS